MKLPKEFLENIHEQLGSEYDDFLASYDAERHVGIRVNTLKISVEEFKSISPFSLEEIPWTKDGFYIDAGERPGKHPLWHAGLYYIQEPSAMIPAELLDIPDGFCGYALDLCASPGGKTLQMARSMKGKGVLVSNDISTGRIKALVRNIEQFGVTNAYVVNEDPVKMVKLLADGKSSVFDYAVVDAPCSGEGMFRKDESLIRHWKVSSNKEYSVLQKSIISDALSLLKDSGTLVYSTCTFSRIENEDVIGYAVDTSRGGVTRSTISRDAEKMFTDAGLDLSDGCLRAWPHKANGEGHFASRLVKDIDGEGAAPRLADCPKLAAPKPFVDFMAQNMSGTIGGPFEIIDSRLYRLPCDTDGRTLPIKGLRVARSGWLLGEIKGERFEPSQALAMGIRMSDFKRVINFDEPAGDVVRYLKGETINAVGEDGLNLICVMGYPLGFGKLRGGVLKNQYSKAWRMM